MKFNNFQKNITDIIITISFLILIAVGIVRLMAIEDLLLFEYEPTRNENVIIIEEKSNLEHQPVCSSNTFKSWMDFRAITSVESKQYKLQSMSVTNQTTGIREFDGYLEVAMAGIYGPVGTQYEVTFDSNQKIKVIIGDVKADTDCEHLDGSMIEFIVDKNLIPQTIKSSGNFNSMFMGSIVEIRKEIDVDF